MYKYKLLTIAAALGTSALLFPGCTRQADEKPLDTKFKVTDTLLNSLLIDTVKEAGSLSEITLTGSIAPDENKMAKIYPMVSGVTEDVHILLGDIVSKGQTLATMRSMEVAGFSKDMISSDADLRNTKRILQSTQDMYKSGLASGKDLEQAKSDYEKALAEHNRASSVMSINHSTNRGYVIKAPISGYIVEKNITNNMQIRADNSQSLFTIADLSSVYILVNIYESDITSVKTGYPVKITTLAYPGKVFTGHIDKVYNMIDPDMKVMRARVKIENPGNLLKPQMFANVVVSAKSDQDLPVINTRAIVLDNDRNYVIVRDGKAKVHIQPITISKRFEDRAYISAGLKPGDQIIASRQLFLYESLKK
ncbi:cobalt-zinc-cadmium efflux system membrane fusion protein [Pedobacter cryoconitis]|uniref:Cobalt-zinc-cadmium efflux system membrane fusion protein n=1 Tax=Pedobacter cryoconitis TaxID=188932 RepID=A0A7W8ZRD2_9SPHI|nr:efflux RND transporter periplasmic adaptor subunit [Pedobacter cryoconitis]MBB5638786.1 cobalt-zinc-cadmium efflux system membrane fusion protein [Pedobacter cryoconitis]MBB6270205.1 cobalt-zinc-cadmium efflux system membrane fusion protein [Pedobacter cryoconitis]